MVERPCDQIEALIDQIDRLDRAIVTEARREDMIRLSTIPGVWGFTVTRNDNRAKPWTKALIARTPFKVAAVALANKMPRIVWAFLNKGGTYRRSEPLTAIAIQ